MNFKKITLISIISLVLVFDLSSCSDDKSKNAEYKDDKYIGTGKSETMVDVVIRNNTEIFYIGKVKIVDDKPNLQMALGAIEDKDNNSISIKLDENGNVKKINTIENTKKKKWYISLDNIIIDKNLKDILINDNNIGVTISYESIK
ncbi:MAG: hypothetical protein ABF289_17390 [Clostridiales bacterium]